MSSDLAAGASAPPAAGGWGVVSRIRRAANRPYLVASLLLALFSVATVLQTFQQAPVPPGFDSADWTQRSYAFVGLPHPPVQAVGSPFVYPPLIFPFLGLLVRATQSSLYPGFIFAALLLLGFGLTTIHLSRRLLRSGPAQLGFVAASTLNGTVLSMVYWGGYPNFAAFLLANEAFVCLAGFLHTRKAGYALGMWGFVALTYLDHTLTFVLLLAALVLGFFLAAIADRRHWSLLPNWGNLAGIVGLVGVIAVYTEVTDALGISHASYLFSNPAAYSLNSIGQFFTPLASEPAFLPAAGTVYLSNGAAVAVLAGSALSVLAIAAAVVWRRRRPTPTSLLLSTAWLVTCLAAPVGGWYAHVDTVYSRFLYFLPVPFALFLASLADMAVVARAGEGGATNPAAAGSALPAPVRRVTRLGWVTDVALFLVVVLLIATVTVPTATHLEKVNTGFTHDTYFLQAMHALNGNPQPGSVLAAASVVRWTEALTNRGAFEVGPTWLLFFPWQIVNAQETYFALNSEGAVTSNEAAFSFSGLSAPGSLQATPTYSVVYQGINFPVFRVLPSTLNVTVANGSGSLVRTLTAGGLSSLHLATDPAAAELPFSAPGVFVNETATPGVGGSGWLNFSVGSASGVGLEGLSFSLAGYPASTQLVNANPVGGAAVTGSRLYWNVSAGVGPLPDPVPIASTADFSLPPRQSVVNLAGPTPSATFAFSDPSPGRPFALSLHVRSTPTSNPAVTLPTVLSTSGYLAAFDIHFILLPNRADYLPTAHQFAQAYGFRTYFVNPEWTILQG